MDPLTHSATGLFLGRAGLDRITPRATWVLFLAANTPDIDVVASMGGSLDYLHYHRHWTHSIPALPLMALLPLLVVRLVSRRPLHWGKCYALSLIGVASHLALDLTNIYGIRLMLPFSGRWFRLDFTNVIDIWIWAVFLLAILGPVVAGLVLGEIGARSHSGRGFAVVALTFLALYSGGRAVLHERAVAILDSRIYAGLPALRVAAFPSAGNPLHWRGLVETRDSYSLYEIRLGEEFDPHQARVFYKSQVPVAALAALRGTEVFQVFLDFSQFPFWRITPDGPGNAIRVEVLDLRFGDPNEPGFVTTAILDSENRPVRAWFDFGLPKAR